VFDTRGRPMRDLRISVTDRCNFRCTYCMPAEVYGERYTFLPKASILTYEEIARVAGVFTRLGVRKIRLTGGEPLVREGLETLVAMLARIDGIDDLAMTTNGYLLKDKAQTLKEAGLQSMPGGGAEVFSTRVHRILLPGKANADRWGDIHKIAHRMGIPTNCTLLYGHIETFEERAEHLVRLRNIQDETRGFLAFIPLEYQVGTTRLRPRHTPAMDDLKMIATARLMLDNIKYIKSYWVMLGEATASIGLNFGANDLDGTIGKERIAHAALADSPAGRARERMVSSIRDARRIPVERDALYNEIKVYQ